MVMNKHIFCLLLFFLMSNVVIGQALIEPINAKSKPVVEEFNNRIAVVDYEQINIDLTVLEQKSVQLSFFEKVSQVTEQKLEVRDLNNFSWFGKSESQGTSIILSVMGKDIQGIISYNAETYRIETVKEQYFVTKIDQSKYPNEICEGVSETVEKKINELETPINNGNQNLTNSFQITGEPFTCRLRLLVMYTPAAQSASSNIINTIQLAVDEMNQSFTNSSINREVELVYVEQTNYTESFYQTDLDRFWKNNDGFMDEVHNLRTEHQADVCALIMDDQALCGIAKTLKASAPNAFCLVNWDCATGYFSFAHEIGHLIGCQHNQNDPTHNGLSADYPFAHGYKSPNNDWRTIMAYNCPGGCNRIQFWSNPSVNFNSLPMGTTGGNDNARMIDDKYPNVMSLLQPNSVVMVEQQDVLGAHEGDVIALTHIVNNGSVSIQGGQAYSFRAGQEVTLVDGFTAQTGNDFVAEITNVTDCGQPDGMASDYGLTNDELARRQIASKTIIDFSLYPNPTVDQFNVALTLEEAGEVTVSLYNFLGKQVRVLSQNTHQAGAVELTYNVADLQSGIYFVLIHRNNQELLKQKLVKR